MFEHVGLSRNQTYKKYQVFMIYFKALENIEVTETFGSLEKFVASQNYFINCYSF